MSGSLWPTNIKKPANDVKPKFTERKCMCCTDPFMSEGIHNRMCRKCLDRDKSFKIKKPKGKTK